MLSWVQCAAGAIYSYSQEMEFYLEDRLRMSLTQHVTLQMRRTTILENEIHVHSSMQQVKHESEQMR